MAKQPAAKTPPAAEAEVVTEDRSPMVICRQVMAALGRPADFLRITARQVSSDNYRVNVLAGADASTARVAHSFFVTADDAGNVTGSSPSIVKQY
jgi:hypothetical protein